MDGRNKSGHDVEDMLAASVIPSNTVIPLNTIMPSNIVIPSATVMAGLVPAIHVLKQERRELSLPPPISALCCGYHFRFLFGACVSADAATLLMLGGVFGLLKSLDAFEATDLEVCSGFLAILAS